MICLSGASETIVFAACPYSAVCHGIFRQPISMARCCLYTAHIQVLSSHSTYPWPAVRLSVPCSGCPCAGIVGVIHAQVLSGMSVPWLCYTCPCPGALSGLSMSGCSVMHVSTLVFCQASQYPLISHTLVFFQACLHPGVLSSFCVLSGMSISRCSFRLSFVHVYTWLFVQACLYLGVLSSMSVPWCFFSNI